MCNFKTNRWKNWVQSGFLTAAVLFYGTCSAASFTWIDPKTGHRVTRLDDTPDVVSSYFHVNSFTQSGYHILLHSGRDFWLYDTLSGTKRQICHWEGEENRITGFALSQRTGLLYYIKDATIWVFDTNTWLVKKLVEIPRPWARTSSLTLNSSETMLAGVYTEDLSGIETIDPRDQWIRSAENRKVHSLIFTINIASAAVKVAFRDRGWIDHPQFSPSDDNLLSYVKQVRGGSQKDSIFVLSLKNERSMSLLSYPEHGEAAIHNFFDPSGRQIWYDLQSPWGRNYYIGATNVYTGSSVRYPVTKEQWSLHYNIKFDGRTFAGDGNPTYPGGSWIWLFRYEGDHITAERLVDMAKNDYRLEPNVQFTPDGRFVIFRANFEGVAHAYMVEVSK